MENREKLINAFIQKPTTYDIEVRDASMLPEELKDRKEIAFTIKPPTAHVLGLCASLMSQVPKEVVKMEEIDLEKALEYRDTIAGIISVLSHETMEHPTWCVPFIIHNVAIVDLLKIMNETAVKCNPSFFLSCFQMAEASNPMMLHDSTPTGS